MLSIASAASAIHRLSSYAVREIAKRTDAVCMELVRSAVDALHAEMDQRGVCASTFIHQAAPAGVHDGVLHCVVDRKAAYRFQLEHMVECPAAQRVFSDPAKTLLEWSAASNNARLTSGVGADVALLFGDAVPEALKAKHVKECYKTAYGKICNAVKADPEMSVELVQHMKLVGELVRRRNAVILMDHAQRMQGSFMAAYTDSLLLRGVDPQATAAAMSIANKGQVWVVESVATVVVLAKINTHLFVLQDGAVLTRPHEMFGGELARSGLDPNSTTAFKGAIVDALTRKDFVALRHLYDQVPATLEMPNAAGKLNFREPSVRRLLGNVLSLQHTSPSTKRKRGAAGVYYARLADAKQAQLSVSEPCFVVGEDRAGSKGMYRRWVLMREQELVRCVGKPCHMTFVGRRVAYRVVVDYDEPHVLVDADVQTFADRVKAFWQDRKQLVVSVRALRTKTQRQGPKAHAEHIVFVVCDDVTGKECLLLNPEEIPLALGGSNDSDNHAVIDELIYKLGKSLRLPGCPKIDASGAPDMASVHTPVDCDDWMEEYTLWSPCALIEQNHIVHCDVMPAHDTVSAAEHCPFLFPSELFFADAFVKWVARLCGGGYAYDQPKVFYWNKNAQNDPDCNSFILAVVFKSKTAKDKKFLDYTDFARRVAVPWLKRSAQNASAASCKHHSSNHSYFVFKVDADSTHGRGEIRGINASTHHGKGAKTNSARHNTYLTMDNAAKSRIVGEDTLAFEAMVEQERKPVLSVTLAQKSEYDAEVRKVNAFRVRLALLRRHRAHQPGRMFPTEGRRDGWNENRASSHEDTVIAVTSLVRRGGKALALQAVFTELKFYKTNIKGKKAGYVVQRLEELKKEGEKKKDNSAQKLDAAWGAVVRYATRVTYNKKVY